MWQEIKLLTKLQICNILGYNQFKYSKDKKKKRQFILEAMAYLILSVILVAYSGGMTFIFIVMGIEEIIMPVIIMVVSIITILFTIYKMGSIIFNLKTFEILIALPVSTAAIVISRFLRLYIQSIVITALIIIPVMLIYGTMLSVGIGFYLLMFLSIFFICLLPMTLSTAMGALIKAATSRMKHKNIVTIILSLVCIACFFGLQVFLSSSINIDIENVVLSTGFRQEMVLFVQNRLYDIYPPTMWFTTAVVNNDIFYYFLFMAVSLSVFGLLITLIQWRFRDISAAINARGTSPGYKMQELSTNRVLVALYKKELKLLFSSSVYSINNIIGGMLAILFASILFFFNVEQIDSLIPFSNIQNILPLVISLICTVSSTTTASISMEGKYWWITQSLPVESKQLIDSKVLVNMTIAIPSYIITIILMFLRFRFSIVDYVWMLLIPIVYIGFASIVGIWQNIKKPVFDWETEATVVKQGGAVLVSMLIDFISTLLPLILVLVIPNSVHIIMALTLLIVGSITICLYRKCKSIDIRTIGEK